MSRKNNLVQSAVTLLAIIAILGTNAPYLPLLLASGAWHSFQDRKVVDEWYIAEQAANGGAVIDQLFVEKAHALTSTYDFSVCGSTCDTSTTWWASDDDVDVFPFANNSANRNAHTENVDADYTALGTSDDSRQASVNPGTGDEIMMWFEMDVGEDPATIGQIDFTYEGFTTSVANFSIYLKDDTTAFQNDVAWVRVGLLESIAASTEESFTRSFVGMNFADYIDSNGMITWGVAESVANVVVSTDYAKLDVVTHTVEQEGYRWRDDDGSETTASWLEAQDTDITRTTGTNTRLRTVLNDTVAGNQATTQYQLEYREDSDTVWRPVQASSGSVAYSSAGTASANQTVVLQMTAPATVNRGDLLVMTIANKYPTNDPDVPAGWTLISNAQQSGGIGTTGVDTGQIYSTVFVREAEGWEDSVIFSVSVPSANSSEGDIFRFTKGTGKEWDLAATNGSDNTGSSNTWSVTGAGNPGITSGDMLLVASAANTDLYSWSAQSVSATGATIGSHTERVETVSTGGDDLELIVSTHAVTAGTATDVPVFTMTSSGNSATAPGGASVILRIRQVDAPIQLSASSNITASGENTTAQLTAPSGGPSFTAGRIQDDENPADTVDINDSEYTEMEWNMTATSEATNGDVYQFRVTANGQVLTTYTVTPQWTIGSGATAPTVTTNFASNVGATSATLHGSITSNGGADATEHGFAYSTNSTLSSGVSTTTLGGYTGAGNFSGGIVTLSSDTTYYFRAYATNSAGTGFGAILSFFTGNSNVTRNLMLFEGAVVKFLNGNVILHQR